VNLNTGVIREFQSSEMDLFKREDYRRPESEPEPEFESEDEAEAESGSQSE
jgi:hypothetical protein